MESVLFKTRISKVGNSAVVTLSAEMLAALDAREGDTVYLMRGGDGGLKIMLKNPEADAALAVANFVMDENRDMLQALAQAGTVGAGIREL